MRLCDIFEYRTPIILYHGTGASRLSSIFEIGLKRREDDTKTANTIGNNIYLTKEIETAITYADLHDQDDAAIVVVRVKPSKLVPDEDEIIAIGIDMYKEKQGVNKAQVSDGVEMVNRIQKRFKIDLGPSIVRQIIPTLVKIYQSIIDTYTIGRSFDRDNIAKISRLLHKMVDSATKFRHSGPIKQILGAIIIHKTDDWGHTEPSNIESIEIVGNVPQAALSQIRQWAGHNIEAA